MPQFVEFLVADLKSLRGPVAECHLHQNRRLHYSGAQCEYQPRTINNDRVIEITVSIRVDDRYV